VGAFENEDEDIYGVESLANYDTVLGEEPLESGRKNFGWTAPKHGSGQLSKFCLVIIIVIMIINVLASVTLTQGHNSVSTSGKTSGFNNMLLCFRNISLFYYRRHIS